MFDAASQQQTPSSSFGFVHSLRSPFQGLCRGKSLPHKSQPLLNRDLHISPLRDPVVPFCETMLEVAKTSRVKSGATDQRRWDQIWPKTGQTFFVRTHPNGPITEPPSTHKSSRMGFLGFSYGHFGFPVCFFCPNLGPTRFPVLFSRMVMVLVRC